MADSDSNAAPQAPLDLDAAGLFIKSALASRTITDSDSGQPIPVAVQKVEIKTGLSGDKQSVHFLVEGDKSFELNQLAVANATKEVLSQIPSLAQNFNFTGTPDETKPTPVVHNWRGDKNIDFKFDLPQGVEPAAVIRDIQAMAQAAAPVVSSEATPVAMTPAPASPEALPTNLPVLGKHTADVAARHQAAANEDQARGAA